VVAGEGTDLSAVVATGAGEGDDNKVEGSFTATVIINPAEQWPATSQANTISPTSACAKV
jgi:hypothetical protein